jgi:hypothetical protein
MRGSPEEYARFIDLFPIFLKKPGKTLDSAGGGDIIRIKILEKLNCYDKSLELNYN